MRHKKPIFLLEIEKIKEINKEARDYYLGETDPENFKREILKIVGPKLEIVA